MGQQVPELFIRGCTATLTAWLWWGQCRGCGVGGGWQGSVCGGRGHQRGNAVANEC